MKNIEFKSNYGNFAYRMTAEVGEEVNEQTVVLCQEGLANICYRVAGSAVDKELGVKKGEGRKSVLYAPNCGDDIDAAVSKKLKELEGKQPVLTKLNLSFMVTGQHEFGAVETGTKEATAVWIKIQALPEPEFKTQLAKLKLDDSYTDETAIVAIARTLREARKAAAEAATAGLLGV